MSISDSVWNRRGSDEISRNLFMLIYGVTTLIGLGLTAFTANFTRAWAVYDSTLADYVWAGPVPQWMLIVGVLLVAIPAIFIGLASDVPVVSFTCLVVIAVALGLTTGPQIAQYSAVSIVKALTVTFLLTAVLTVMGACIPESLASFGGLLLSGLFFVIIAQIGLPFLAWVIPNFPVEGALTAIDMIAAAIFSLYIIYDVNMALRVPATVDNAIDAALALYLDVLNLFLIILRNSSDD